MGSSEPGLVRHCRSLSFGCPFSVFHCPAAARRRCGGCSEKLGDKILPAAAHGTTVKWQNMAKQMMFTACSEARLTWKSFGASAATLACATKEIVNPV